jgi:polyisoprenoid-binding protein YceI
MVTTVRGTFADVSGTLDFDPAHPENAHVEATIGTRSLTTGVADRDAHLRSGDFLETEKFPTITFKSTRVVVENDHEARIHGDLTIRDVTHDIVLDAEFLGQEKDPWGNTKIGFEASTRINRETWGLTWNVALESGGVLVGKDIKLEISAQALLVREPAPEAATVS